MDKVYEYTGLLNEASEKRRNAYVDAVTMKARGEVLTGVMGTGVPSPILRAYGIIPLYIASTDGHAENFSKSDTRCILLRSTEGYSVSGKCPLIYSVSSVITDDICAQRVNALEYISDGRLNFVFDGTCENRKRFIEFLERASGNSEPKFKKAIEENNAIFDLCRKLNNLIDNKDIGYKDALTIHSGLLYSLTMDDKRRYLTKAIDVLKDLKVRKRPAKEKSSFFNMGFENLSYETPGTPFEYPEDTVPSKELFCDGEYFRFIESDFKDPVSDIIKAFEKRSTASPGLLCKGCTAFRSNRKKVIYRELL